MENQSKLITQLLINTFTLEKVRIDILGYLNENCNNWFRKEEKYFSLEAFNIDTEQNENIRLSTEEEINIIAYFTKLTSNYDLYFDIIIGIGTYIKTKDSISMFTVDKCLAKLKYNSDLTISDVDFYLTEINKHRA